MKKSNWGLATDVYEHWAWMPVFSPEECSVIIDIGNSLESIDAAVTHNEHRILDDNIRKTTVSWIPIDDSTMWIFQKCTEVVNLINEKYFNFKLQEIESLQFTVYDKTGSFYAEHIDILNSYSKGSQRKLSFSIQLSDPNSYSGGDLLLKYKSTPEFAKKEQGFATLFPSYCLHEVTPITAGTRYSLVGWVTGPKFE